MSTLEVNKIVPQTGTDIQLGEAGDTVSFPPGTAGGLAYSEKSSNFTAVSGNAYIIDTSGGAVQATLPSSANIGDQVHFIDGTGSFDSNNLTVIRNNHNIQGDASNLVVSVERAGFSLIYYNATNGWILKDV